MPLPTTYDELFRKYSDGIPIPFLRALVKKESGFNPVVNSKGLMQITPTARKDYNQRAGGNVTSTQLLDPEINIKVGTWVLRTYADYLDSLGIPSLRENWKSPAFVTALVAGWNSGVYGYAKAAKKVVARGDSPTHSNVMQEWRKTDAFLGGADKARWQRSVTDLYMSEIGERDVTEVDIDDGLDVTEVDIDDGLVDSGGLTLDDLSNPDNWGIDSSDRKSLSTGGKVAIGLLAVGLLAWGVSQWR